MSNENKAGVDEGMNEKDWRKLCELISSEPDPKRLSGLVDALLKELDRRTEKGQITLTPKTAIDRHLAEGLEDVAQGRPHGPYQSATEAISALERRAAK